MFGVIRVEVECCRNGDDEGVTCEWFCRRWSGIGRGMVGLTLVLTGVKLYQRGWAVFVLGLRVRWARGIRVGFGILGLS